MTSCIKDPIDSPQESGGVDLKFSFSLKDFNMGIPEVTKSEEQIQTTDINSFVLCLFKMDEVNPSNSRIVGYRIFINGDELGNKYFFKNLNGYTGDDDVTPLANVGLSDAGGIYTSETDDTNHIDPLNPKLGPGENYISADKQSVQVEFRYNHPLHGMVEKLRDGKYLVVALVNFHEEPIVAIHRTLGYWIKEQIKYWQVHQSDEEFNGIVYEPVIDGSGDIVFAGSKQIIDARVRLYDAKIQSLVAGGDINDHESIYIASHGDEITSESYIHSSNTSLCASTSQVINVKSGENLFGLNLTRLATRASFKINNIGTVPIVIEDFALSSNFGSAATYLFPVAGEQSEHNSPTWLGRPIATSPHANVPFVPHTEYAVGSSKIFFDALLASGYDATGTNPLSFNIRVSASNGNVSETWVDPMREYSNLIGDLNSSTWAVGTSREYLLQTGHTYGTPAMQLMIKSNGESTPLAYYNSTSNATSELSYVTGLVETGNADEYIWIFEKVNFKNIIIKNKSVDKYLKLSSTAYTDSGHNLTYTSNSAEATVFEIGQFIGASPSSEQRWVENAYRESFKHSFALATNRNDGYRNEIFLNVLSSKNMVSLNKWVDRGSHLYAYRVDHKIINNDYKELTVPVKAYDKKTGIATPLHELKRNNHLNVDINVNYNDSSQDFEFSVVGWDNKENTIEFE